MSYVIGADDKGTVKKYVQYLDNAVNNGGVVGEYSTEYVKESTLVKNTEAEPVFMFELCKVLASDGNTYLDLRWGKSFSKDIVGSVIFNESVYYIKNEMDPILINSSTSKGFIYIYYDMIEGSVFKDTSIYSYASYLNMASISQLDDNVSYVDLYEKQTKYSTIALIGFYDYKRKKVVQVMQEEEPFVIFPYDSLTPCLHKKNVVILSKNIMSSFGEIEDISAVKPIGPLPRYISEGGNILMCSSDYSIEDIDFYTDSKNGKVVGVRANDKVALYWKYIGSCKKGVISFFEPTRTLSFRNTAIDQDGTVVFDFDNNTLRTGSYTITIPSSESIIYLRKQNATSTNVSAAMAACTSLSKEEYEAYKIERDIIARKSSNVYKQVESIQTVIDSYIGYVYTSNSISGKIVEAIRTYLIEYNTMCTILTNKISAENSSFSAKGDTIQLERSILERKLSMLSKASDTYDADALAIMEEIKKTYEEDESNSKEHIKALDSINDSFKNDYSNWCTKASSVCKVLTSTLNPLIVVLREFRSDVNSMRSMIPTKLDEGISLERELLKLDTIVYGSAVSASFPDSIVVAGVDEVLEPTDSYAYIPLTHIHMKDNVYFAESTHDSGVVFNTTLPSIFEK